MDGDLQALVDSGKISTKVAAALEKLQHSQPAAITKARLELEKLRTENARSHEKLEKLRHDRELMNVQAPRSGVVYYGAYRLGQWTTFGEPDEAGHVRPQLVELLPFQAHGVSLAHAS